MKRSRSYLKAMRAFRGGSKKHAAAKRRSVRLPAVASRSLRGRAAKKRATTEKQRRAARRNLKLARAARMGVAMPVAKARPARKAKRRAVQRTKTIRRAARSLAPRAARARVARAVTVQATRTRRRRAVRKTPRKRVHARTTQVQETRPMARKKRCKIRKTRGYRYKHPKGKTVTVKHRARRVCKRHRVKAFTYTAPKRRKRISYRRKRPHRTPVSYVRSPRRIHVKRHMSWEQQEMMLAARRPKRRRRKAARRMGAHRRKRHSSRSPMLTLATARALIASARRPARRRSRRRNPVRHHRRRKHHAHRRRHHARSYLPNPVYQYSMERSAHDYLSNPLTGPELAFAFVAGGVAAAATDMLRRWYTTKDIAAGAQDKSSIALVKTPDAKSIGVQAGFVLLFGIATAVAHNKGKGTAAAIAQGGLLGSGLYLVAELITIGVTKAFASNAKVQQMYADVAIANAAAPGAGLAGLPQGPVAGVGAFAPAPMPPIPLYGPSTVVGNPNGQPLQTGGGQFWMPPVGGGPAGGPLPPQPVPGGGGCNPCSPCGDTEGQNLVNTIANGAMPVASAQSYQATLQEAFDTAQKDLCAGGLSGAPTNGVSRNPVAALGFFGE